jgi:hypothetical protein
MTEPTVALSIQQPWAWLIVQGHKDIENRNWQTSRRGPIYIHTGKTIDREAWAWVARKFPKIAQQLPRPEQIEKGGIVGVAHLIDCVLSSPSPWFSGPFGLALAQAKPVPFVPCKGALGFFKPNLEAVQ